MQNTVATIDEVPARPFMAALPAVRPSEVYAVKIKAIRRELRDEYCQPHTKPWIVGFSGGKDSTLLAHLIFDCLLALSPSDRKRPVFLVCNDTLVESPVFQAHVNKLLDQIAESLDALRVPVQVVKTHPLPEESFWVNLLGRGYPAPNRNFRWCTDRMKIRPTTRFIQEQVNHSGEAILVLGTRRAESAHRAHNMAEREKAANGARLSPHSDLKGCFIFSPIKDLTTDEVWLALLNSRPPWGGSYRDLVALYKDANGGECPFVVSEDDTPSCGTGSARFGCWTCTVVKKDNSIDSLIASGQDHLEPLAEFRKLIRRVSETPDYRSKTRRDGRDGLGPLTLDARKMLLEQLLTVQQATGMDLISPLEIRLVREQWTQDKTQAILREIEKFSKAGLPTKNQE